MENKLTNRFARFAAIFLMLIMAVCCFSVRGGGSSALGICGKYR